MKKNVVMILTRNLEEVSELCEKIMKVGEAAMVFFNTERLKINSGYAELRDRIESYEDDGCRVAIIFVSDGNDSDFARVIVNRPARVPIIFLGAEDAENESIVKETVLSLEEFFRTKKGEKG